MRVTAYGNLKSRGYHLSPGDTITVPDEIGAEWCARGWASDADGLVPTGERKPGAQRLNPASVKAEVGRG